MNLVETHIVDKEPFKDLMKMSKALYNTGNYIMRQAFEYHYGSRLYKDCDKQYRKIFKEKMINYYDLEKNLMSRLPSWTRQQILMKLDKDWKGFYGSKGRKRGLPGFKHKENELIFTGQNVSGGTLLPRLLNYKLSTDKVPVQVRVIPYSRRKVKLEIVYKVEERPLRKTGKTMGIDLGLNNLATCVTQDGNSFIVNGRPLKAMNKYYNMKVAELQKDRSRKDQYPLNKVRDLAKKRNAKVNDYLHKASKLVISKALELGVNKIVIGKNVGWKTECKLKNFVQIPHARFINLIEYKAYLQGIEVVLTEESYTSKIDHLSYEIMEKQENYSGQRIYRGLFQSMKLINADVNGAIGIMRKVSGDKFLRTLISKGLVYNPVRVNID